MSKEQSATHDEKACADWYHDNYQRLQVEANKSGKPMALYIAQEAWKTAQSETEDKTRATEAGSWLPLLEMFEPDKVLLYGAAGEDAMNVADVVRFVRELAVMQANASTLSATLESVPSPVKMALKILLNHIEPGWENSAAFVKAWLEDQNAFAE